MAKSRRFQPGDSAPDFSQLADHDQQTEQPQWRPPDDEPSPPARAVVNSPHENSPNENSHDENSAGEKPQDAEPPASVEDPPASRPERTQEASADRDESSVGDSHVFFETDVPASADELAGETTAYTPVHQQSTADDVPSGNAPPGKPLPGDNAADGTAAENSLPQHDEADVDEVQRLFAAAPDLDETAADLSQDNSTGLTDVGIPVFTDPPGLNTAAEPDAPDEPDATAETDDLEETAHFDGPVSDAAVAEPTVIAATDINTTAIDATVVNAADVNVAVVETTDSGTAVAQPTDAGARAGGDAAVRQSAGVVTAPPAPAAGDRQRLLLILLASYASAMTIGFLWMWLAGSSARPHELESLPDVAPLGPNEFRYVPQSAAMPPGHTLPLGEARQLGHIRVEPLRVTRGPVQYAHYSDASQSKPPTASTLKLWLRFTNVSADQWIAPLDATLLLMRSYQAETDTMLANQLLLSADRTALKPACVIDHPTTSEWDLAGQELGRRLKPGESLETYIPLQPGSDEHLQGDLLWRVHFRKGFHEGTGHGVTTMIEVPFSRADIQTEPATATATAT